MGILAAFPGLRCLLVERFAYGRLNNGKGAFHGV
jgi:hypothetical protein